MTLSSTVYKSGARRARRRHNFKARRKNAENARLPSWHARHQSDGSPVIATIWLPRTPRLL